MDFRKFYSKCVFKLFAVGDSNWDLYTMQYSDKPPSVVSLAKPGTGASDSCWTHSIERCMNHLDKLERNGINHGYSLV